MDNEYAFQAIQSVLSSSQAYCKFISANDSGATGGHQSGILISRSAEEMLFSEKLADHNILKRAVHIKWQGDFTTESSFTYYRSKGEFRITRFGRDFPFLVPAQTGALFVLTRQDADDYSAFFLDTDDEIDTFLNAFCMSPTETNRLIDPHRIVPETREQMAIQEFIANLDVDFPTSGAMSEAARMIQHQIFNHAEEVRTNPDKKIIAWTNTEFALFRALEDARYGNRVREGFPSVDEFVDMANMVMNRRKSRAGKSFENQLSAIFDGNDITYTAQAITEGNKRPDFLFPSADAYHDATYPVDRLVSLAAKTTCKDRWRQVINEANRLRNRPKFLCTLQQGISPAQMDEMQEENVTLVVPRSFIGYYPADRRDRIWTVAKFVQYIREIENS